MKLYFMKQEALEILKSNLKDIYTMYFTEKDNKWLWNVCGGDPFIEFKDVPEFSLASLDENTKGEAEFQNCKIIYEKLKFLNESQACDERLWAGLCHSIFYEYLRKRWDYDTNKPKKSEEINVSNIKSRFFFSGGIRAGLYRNSIAKCWWVGRNTYDIKRSNPFEKLDIIGSNDISTKISDIFYSNNFSSNPIILDGIIEAIQYLKNNEVQLSSKEHIRPSLQLLNAIGGVIILDCISKEEIRDILIENVYSIIKGDDSVVEVDSTYSYDELNKQDIDTDEYDICVSIGHKVEVLEKETGENKIILVNYLPQIKSIPKLAKQLIGKKIDDETKFKGLTYKILKIEEIS